MVEGYKYTCSSVAELCMGVARQRTIIQQGKMEIEMGFVVETSSGEEVAL